MYADALWMVETFLMCTQMQSVELKWMANYDGEAADTTVAMKMMVQILPQLFTSLSRKLTRSSEIWSA